jgi:hypothetical protein
MHVQQNVVVIKKQFKKTIKCDSQANFIANASAIEQHALKNVNSILL